MKSCNNKLIHKRKTEASKTKKIKSTISKTNNNVIRIAVQNNGSILSRTRYRNSTGLIIKINNKNCLSDDNIMKIIEESNIKKNNAELNSMKMKKTKPTNGEPRKLFSLNAPWYLKILADRKKKKNRNCNNNHNMNTLSMTKMDKKPKENKINNDDNMEWTHFLPSLTKVFP